MRLPLLLLAIYFTLPLYSQTNIRTFHPESNNVLTGNYDPSDYAATTIINQPSDIAEYINEAISSDSLKSFIEKLVSFETRNSGSDTLSTSTGIGAARNWIYQKFQSFSARNEDRLIADFLQFDRTINGVTRHKNVLGILPGTDPSKGVIIVEGHMDSRCEDNSDVTCLSPGADDNASGTALVIELARVMSAMSLDRTFVFMTTTAEEQGLLGATAMAIYCEDLNIDVKSVFNNDVVGGIICGETASEPSCPEPGHIDSSQVRIFSAGGNHKNLARYVKLQYQEMLEPLAEVPMAITIMSLEDRAGRGGDHIPFRERGFTAIRFTSANEHGDAGVADPDYMDHQHTSDDILGVDTDGDMIIDSFFVDFNYLNRNASINAIAASMVAISPPAPTITLDANENIATVTIIDPDDILNYRVGVRSVNNDFDTLIPLLGTKQISIPLAKGNIFYFFTACSVDDRGIESCFSNEEFILTSSNHEITDKAVGNILFMGNYPNPFAQSTSIHCYINDKVYYDQARLVVTDLLGATVWEKTIDFKIGLNKWQYEHHGKSPGTYICSLVIDGSIISSKKMHIGQ